MNPEGKQGVRAAVDDFLLDNPDWVKFHCRWHDDCNDGWADAVIITHQKNPMTAVLAETEFEQKVYSACMEKYKRTSICMIELEKTKISIKSFTPAVLPAGWSVMQNVVGNFKYHTPLQKK